MCEVSEHSVFVGKYALTARLYLGHLTVRSPPQVGVHSPGP